MARTLWISLLVFMIAAVSRPCAGADKMNFAYSALSGLQAPLWVAKEAGFFKKHDIDAQVLFIVGGRVISQAMFAGELQMGLSSMAALLQANAAGGDLTYVGYFGSKTDYALFSTKDITNVKQLRGKRLGIGQFGGGPDFASRIVLEKHGLIPDKDVRILQMLVPDSGRLAALQAGAIEAIMLQAPTSLRAQALGFNQLLDFSNELLFPLASLTTTRAYIKQNPAAVKRAVRAHLDAVRFMFANEDATLKILARYTKISDTAFLRDYHRKIILPRLSQTLAPDRAAIDFILDVEKKRNPVLAKFKAEGFYDPTFVDELRKEGY
jgi:NitT/TauT family transport system substrate-binding protein